MQTGVVLNQENKKDLALTVALLVSAWAVYILVRYGDVLSMGSARYSVAQFSAAPFVLLALLRPLHRLFGLPLFLGGITALGILASGLIFFNLEDTSTRDLYVARLKEDVLDSDSRVLREAIKTRVQASYPFTHVVPYFTGIQSLEDAEMFVVERDEVKALVWGGDTLSLSFPQLPPLALEEMNVTEGQAWEDLIEFREIPLVSRLQVVTSFPYVQLSKEPLDGTTDFIARSFNGYLSYLHRGGFQEASLNLLEELELLASISIDSPWVSREHRAFPYFVLGTAYLRKAFSGSSFEVSYLQCAEHAFRKAALVVQEHRNPELRAAIFNNAAVVKTLLFVATKKLSVFDDAYHMFQEAIQEGGSRLVYRFQVKQGKQSHDVARHNLAKLIKMKRSVREKPKRRRLKKQKKSLDTLSSAGSSKKKPKNKKKKGRHDF